MSITTVSVVVVAVLVVVIGTVFACVLLDGGNSDKNDGVNVNPPAPSGIRPTIAPKAPPPPPQKKQCGNCNKCKCDG